MTPVINIPGSAEDWLARAKSDLALSKIELPANVLYEDLCFHAQQAAEKSLKAIYRKYGWAFRYTHDLSELISGLKNQGLTVPEEIYETDTLTRFAWESRYPYIGETVTKEEYNEAVNQAEKVLIYAEKLIL